MDGVLGEDGLVDDLVDTVLGENGLVGGLLGDGNPLAGVTDGLLGDDLLAGLTGSDEGGLL